MIISSKITESTVKNTFTNLTRGEPVHSVSFQDEVYFPRRFFFFTSAGKYTRGMLGLSWKRGICGDQGKYTILTFEFAFLLLVLFRLRFTVLHLFVLFGEQIYP